ncbi:MAG: TonB family protein [Bacteroidales bacterium]|nr:TonB family protein [Bacteroidales bacterium]
MNAFLLYLLKSTLLLAVFDAFFLLVMRRSGHFRFNRVVLLLGSVACLLLPLIPLRFHTPTLYTMWIAPAVIGVADGVAGVAESAADAAAGVASGRAFALPGWPACLLALYLAGAAATLIYYLRSYGGMFRLLRHTPGERHDGYTLHLLDQDTPSFSWLRHIVLSRSDFARYPAILTHEKTHVRCGHSTDLLLSSLLTVFQWFNPLVWVCRGELKLLHEYEADDFVLNQGIDATQYQLLLVKKAVGEKRFLLANGFNHAQLKNRITMMQTPAGAAWKKFSLLLLIPLLAATVLLLAECTSRESATPAVEQTAETETLPSVAPETKAVPVEDESEPISFALVETKPRFDGGDANKFSHWVNQNLQYPPEAKEKKIQGRVTLQFTVEKDGSVTDVKVLRSPDQILSDAAVAVISNSPKWTPGYVNGEPVRVIYNYPVLFQLK